MNSPTSYKYVAAWLRMVGSPSLELHTEYRQLYAAQTNAPIDSVAQNSNGIWITYADMNSYLRACLDDLLNGD
jgi:hypothetical protein